VKKLSILIALILCVVPLPSYANSQEFKLFEDSPENRFSGFSEKLVPSSEPVVFWECRNSPVAALTLTYEINNSSKNRRIVANGIQSSKPGCSAQYPIRYDFIFDFNKEFLNRLIADKTCIGSCNLNSGSFGLIEYPTRGNNLPLVALINYEATYSDLNPLPAGFTYDTKVKKQTFSSGNVASISVTHNLDSGEARMNVQFRTAPKQQTLSIGYGSGYTPSKDDENIVCSEGVGVKFDKFPSLKISRDSEIVPIQSKYSNKTLTLIFKNEELRAETYREDSFVDLPTCFGISYWTTKSSYSKGNSCSGFIQGKFIDLNCTPYAGWSSWKVVGKSWKLTFDD
jgi:hypothetical protein